MYCLAPYLYYAQYSLLSLSGDPYSHAVFLLQPYKRQKEFNCPHSEQLCYYLLQNSTRVKKLHKTNSITVLKQKSCILKPKVHKSTQEFKIPTGLTTLTQFRRLKKHVNYQEGSAQYPSRLILLSLFCV